MYSWVVFLHVAAVLAFMLAHGVQVTAMWKMRGEADPQQSLTFFNVLPDLLLLRILLGLVILTGVMAAFLGSWWGQGWIWLSLLILGAIFLAMWRYGGPYYGLIQDAATKALEAPSNESQPAAARAAFDAARHSWHPIGMSVIGIGGMGVILWLMMFKPF